MKKPMLLKTLLSGFFLLAFLPLSAQPVWHDASGFPVFGKVTEATSARYERLPAALENTTRQPVWRLGRDAAGVTVRFRSNSTAIHVRWTSTFTHAMNHMAPTGDRGVDLYALTEDGWRYAGTGRPTIGKPETESRLVANMEPVMREYMLHLSLYDGVSDLAIGVDPGAVLEGPAVDSPAAARPVVMYGTSILQGGCASRPGMAHTNILARKLDRQVINLGFSGNALLDEEIARLMASMEDPGVFVLDEVPNSGAATIREKGERFFRILRGAHPDVPVVFVEMPPYPYARFDRKQAAEIAERNAAQRELYGKLRKEGQKRLYYVPGDRLIGTDGEATVDGVHFTDLGMLRYADVLAPVLRKALRKR